MPKLCTKTGSNVFNSARYDAARFNERMSSREGAAETTGIERSRLARIELGTTSPYPEEVILLADAYNAPELMNYYCTNLCPIGRRIAPKAECHQLDRMAIKILSSLDGLKGLGKVMVRIAADGKVTQNEIPELNRILDAFNQAAKTAAEMQIWMTKYVKEEKG